MIASNLLVSTVIKFIAQIAHILILTIVELSFSSGQTLSAAMPIDNDLTTEIEPSNHPRYTTAHPDMIMAESANSDNGVLAPMQIPPTEDGEEEYDEYVRRLCSQAEEAQQCEYELTELEVERFKAAHQYRIWVYNHHRSTFRLKSIIDVFIFSIVVIVVATGLYLSYLEFTKEDKPETKLSLAKGYIEIDSNVIGLVILVVSLVFFYLYIIHIRPVNIVRPDMEVDRQSSLN